MSNKKQTAVEWLQIQSKKGINFNPLSPSSYKKAVDNLFEQAKAMEKQQIIDALEKGKYSFGKDAEQYYKDTFGGDNEQQ